METIIIKEHTLIKDLIKDKNLTIIDLGACIGEFSSKINDLFLVKKSILVEANPTNFNKLPKNKNFICLNKVVYTESNNKIKFKEDLASPYNGSIVLNYFSNTAKEHIIDTICLKKLIEIMNVDDKIDILKIDIEGSEYIILETVSDDILLKFNQITVEFHDFVDKKFEYKNKIIEERFLKLGFKSIKNKINWMNGSEYYDTLFYKL
jgi:FkbM family methyltransferase